MSDISPGQQQYPTGNSITYTLGSAAAVAGDAVAISASSGSLVLTDGSNGFAGILATQTAAGDPDRAAGVGDGSEVTLQVAGIVRAKVSAAVGGTVSAGEQLVPAASGTLSNVDSGGTPAQAGPGDLQAVSDEDAAGYALVKLP